MNLQQLVPWNWFKHEDSSGESTIPIKRNTAPQQSLKQINHPILHLHQEVERLFDQTFRSLPWFASSLSDSALGREDGFFHNLGFRPQLNIASDAQQYHISLEVPGLTEEDVTLELNQNNTLSVRGKKSEEKETKERQYYRIERSYGEFQRLLALPDDSDTEKIRATLTNGVLEIYLPKKPLQALQSNTRKIPISNTSH
ncbi:heat-shock protein Hsp20 [Cellvibrio zantedeschiae]|uniref:Heat-shock protein Hsp20 n=1 Tax=Cellvibrio zantedeschiae TaxID=1237077 RepID=A0ABQ3AP47_9GAMM|nr:Hsp20/alpha crystallin family protein [Cellvibrio zantedeschiae]GGY63346.1 heat-shock protein Hsp20 [Cellvibrio zantedeschiae]